MFQWWDWQEGVGRRKRTLEFWGWKSKLKTKRFVLPFLSQFMEMYFENLNNIIERHENFMFIKEDMVWIFKRSRNYGFSH